MATFSTNTAALDLGKTVTTILTRLTHALRSTPETPEQLLAAQQRQEAARARVDHLLR